MPITASVIHGFQHFVLSESKSEMPVWKNVITSSVIVDSVLHGVIFDPEKLALELILF